MILSAHQPVYLPSPHLFNKIARSDIFMFLGHCQFVNQSWHSRNFIRGPNKPLMLSIPVKKSGAFGQSINDAEIAGTHWKRKHLASIHSAYSKRPYFDFYFPILEDIIHQPHQTLAELDIAIISQILEWLEIDTQVLYSEDHNISGQKNDMLISMCKSIGIEKYVSNEGSRSYVDEAKLKDHGISHFWQEYTPSKYDQGTEFMPNLSIIDTLFNLGGKTGQHVRNCGTMVST